MPEAARAAQIANETQVELGLNAAIVSSSRAGFSAQAAMKAAAVERLTPA